MLGGFAVVPFIATYLVENAGVSEAELPLVYVVGGVCTLFSAPLVGRLADRYGKMQAFRVAVPFSALIMFGITVLPDVGLIGASIAVAAVMVANTSRMVAAMAMITGSVEPARRGGFMSANSSVQHLSAGLGTFLAGLVVTQSPDGRLEGYAWAGLFAAVLTLLSLPFAARLRPAGEQTVARALALQPVSMPLRKRPATRASRWRRWVALKRRRRLRQGRSPQSRLSATIGRRRSASVASQGVSRSSS